MSEKNYVNMGRFAFPIASVPFAGAYYMCVEGSKRHDALNRANHAFNMGYRSLAEELKQEALQAPGCAFEMRESAEADSSTRDDETKYADVCFASLVESDNS